jgi:hypothetical protein
MGKNLVRKLIEELINFPECVLPLQLQKIYKQERENYYFCLCKKEKLIAYDKKQNNCTIENLDTNKLFW